MLRKRGDELFEHVLFRGTEAVQQGGVDVQDADDVTSTVTGTTTSELLAESQAMWPANSWTFGTISDSPLL